MSVMKRKFTSVLFYFCFFTFYLSAQPTQEWVARYERPSGSSGIANQMALDKVGNCYVLGNKSSNGGEVILIKYNASGDTLWTRNYPGAANVGVIADSIGNVYVTGYIGPTFGPYDIYIIKFNTNGIQQWIKTYDTGGSDQSTAILLDKSGNICIAGFGDNESLVLKYNTNGDTIWTRRYTEAGFRFPARTMDIDIKNNVYIGGGKVNISNGTQNYFVIKYDSNGVFKWLNYHSNNGIEVLNKAKVDQNFNLFVTGRSINGRILTVKYDSNGAEQWQRIYTGPVPGGENATDMGIDNFGNVIITGYSSGVGAGNFDFVTIKYSTSGDSLWVKRYNGTANDNDESYSLALDDSNNIYVTGRSINTGVSWDYVTLKYLSNGTNVWTGIYNNQPTNAEDIAYKILLDRNNNIYVTGTSRGILGGPSDYLTIKYSQTVGIDPIITAIPDKYQLEQNYPNPFNPVTNIKYTIFKNNKNVLLQVFDVMGREVEVLVNKKQNKGTYSVSFISGTLASGVYFYKLITEDFTDTKKMVLIK